MPYDEELASRVRELVAGEPEVTEQRMFGGLAFLIGGNMAVAASGQGGARDELRALAAAEALSVDRAGVAWSGTIRR